MSLLANDSLLQLAFSVQQNKGVYALLLGSGLSKSAGVPTGWEITLDLIRRIGLAQGASDQVDWARWYRDTHGAEPDYSALLAELGASPEERRAILHSYIEPSEQERQDGRKLPTAAHHAIAGLVRRGYVRVIITTNFDRLLENALREQGVEATIIASPDALLGAEPLTHSACYVVKLHGDYKDARILNTDTELGSYPAEYNALLDRVLDEHGLIVCGWSGDWDAALRSAYLRAPNRRYSVYWAARSKVSDTARDLIAHRRAKIVSIQDADNFFTVLGQHVETLARSQRQEPTSIDLLVGSAKRFLSSPEHRIQLDDLISTEFERVSTLLDGDEFSTQGSADAEEFRRRTSRYEAIVEPLAAIVGVLGRWGDGSELALVSNAVKALFAQAERRAEGSTVLVNHRMYPAVLLFTAYGIGLTRAEKWVPLHRFLETFIDTRFGERKRLVDALFLWSWDGGEQPWKMIEGLERARTPLSDHLSQLFSEWNRRFLGLTPNADIVFDNFEFLASIAHLESHTKQELLSELEKPAQTAWLWTPVGRYSWRRSSFTRLHNELVDGPARTALLGAGFALGDPEYLNAASSNIQRIIARLRF